MRYIFGATCAIVAVLSSVAFATRPDEANVKQFVEALGNNVIEAIKNNQNDITKRRLAFEEIFRNHGDVPTIARFVAGKAWNSADEATRQAYVETYRKYMAFTYAMRITSYGNQTIKVGRVTDLGDTGYLVNTSIEVPAPQQPISVVWQLSAKDNALKVTDLRVENISMSLTQRSEFSAMLVGKPNDLNLLTQTLSKRIQSEDKLASQ